MSGTSLTLLPKVDQGKSTGIGPRLVPCSILVCLAENLPHPRAPYTIEHTYRTVLTLATMVSHHLHCSCI